MVNIEDIDNSLEKSILKKVVEKRIIEVVKCSSSATKAGEGAVVHMANDPDGVKVPLRRLQHKGFDEEGNDLGYIADITYPNGNKIDYYNGTITLDGHEFQMGFYDNYTTDSNGNVNHVKKGSAEEVFDFQYKEASSSTSKGVIGDKAFLLEMGQIYKSGNVQRIMTQLDKKGINLDDPSVRNAFRDNPKLLSAFDSRLKMARRKNASFTRADVMDLAVGQQVARRDINAYEASRINVRSNVPQSSSVGFLNDKTINVKNDITDETRSLTGHNNNWDNTWKVYTCITQNDGTHAMYLGYPQNAKEGAWDNSGNPYNDLTFFQGQEYTNRVVDMENGIIIRVPNNANWNPKSDK